MAEATGLTAHAQSRYPHVSSPVDIAGCTLPNRIARTAHLSGLARGFVTDSYIDFHVARARGGVGLSILEIGAVHPTCPGALMSYMGEVVDSYQKLAGAMHAEGARVFQQLFHGAELIAFWRDRLASLKCPRTVDFVANLGRNAMGKVNKRQLRVPYWPTGRTIG